MIFLTVAVAEGGRTAAAGMEGGGHWQDMPGQVCAKFESANFPETTRILPRKIL